MDKNASNSLMQELEDANRELVHMQEQLAVANRKLQEYEEKTQKAEKASRMKSLFLANMSHEIRTPLNAIEGFSRVIVETDSLEDRMRFFEIIESNNRQIQFLINEILDLSRIESGEISIRKAPVQLHELCSNMKNLFRFRCPESIKLVYSKPEHNVVFNTDANRLTQVFSNLIDNALKHTVSGSITYGYRLLNNNQEIEFFVKDTGTGISKAELENIFNAYVSGDAEAGKGGYGLGLPLCRIIVEKLGGTISVESEDGKGSVFQFKFPFENSARDESHSEEAAPSLRTIRVSEHSNPINTKTILVAEDEDSNFELIKTVLQKRYRILRAHNGIEAVVMNEEEKPDLILMDIYMPDMNGIDAIRIIKETTSCPVITLSAYAFEENIREAKAAGSNEFMAKPFKVENLIETIQKYID